MPAIQDIESIAFSAQERPPNQVLTCPLGMACQATYPVVQVINGNEQDIGFLRRHRAGTADQGYQEKRQPGKDPGRIHVSRCIRGIPFRRAGLPADRHHPLIGDPILQEDLLPLLRAPGPGLAPGSLRGPGLLRKP